MCHMKAVHYGAKSSGSMKAKPKKYPKKNRCSLDVRPIPVTVIHSRPSRPRKPKNYPEKTKKIPKKNLDPGGGGHRSDGAT